MTDTNDILSRFGLAEYRATKEGKLHLFEVMPPDLAEVMRTLRSDRGLRLKTVAASDERTDRGVFRIHYVFSIPGEDRFLVPFISVAADRPEFPSMTPIVHECSVYEQEIKTFFGLEPVGHPGAERIILHRENFPEDIHPLRKEFAWDTAIAPVTGKSMPEMPRFEGEIGRAHV
jgi:Ni,Fe-hydrogenase III component G